MAKTEFKLGESKKITAANAKKSALAKDARNAQFHIPADNDEVLTLTGDFYEQSWTRGDNSGTMLLAGAMRADNKTEIQVPFGFFRTKELLEEGGIKKFEACFSKNASFEEMVNGIVKDKKIQVKRDGYVYPGRSSSRDVDTVIWAE